MNTTNTSPSGFSMRDSIERVHALALIVLVAALSLGFQGSRGVWDPDEGFYMTIAAEMRQSGDFITPRLHGFPFLDKPPLMYWGSGLGMMLLGPNEWGARLFHALCFALTVWVVFMLGRSMFQDARSGFLAALIYATMIGPFCAANVVTADTPLTLWTTLAYYGFWRSVAADKSWTAGPWKVLMCLAIGLGFLTKGPAIFVIVSAMFFFLLLRRGVIQYFLTFWALPCALAFAAAGLTWYIYVTEKTPGALEYFLDNQVYGRVFSEKYARNPEWYKGPAIYGGFLLAASLPWLFFFPAWLNRARQNPISLDWWKSLPARPAALLLTVWLAVPLIALCSASSKLILYALPLMPALALVMGRAWAQALDRSEGVSTARPGALLLAPQTWAFVALWALLLLGVKATAARVPSEKNARAFWAEIQSHLVEGEDLFKIVAINGEYNGVAFYSNAFFENATIDDEPYPFFMMPDALEEVVGEIPSSDARHYFLCKRTSRRARVESALSRAGIAFETFELRGNHFLTRCDKPTNSSSRVVRVAAVGDTGTGRTTAFGVASAMTQFWASWSFDAILLLGDNIYANEGEYSVFDDAIRAVFEMPFHALIGQGMDFYAILGNHDYRYDGLNESEMKYDLFNMNGKNHYKIVLGDGLVDLFCLDSMDIKTSQNLAQIEWLADELALSQATWKVVALHHPIRTTSRKREPNDFLRDALEPVLVEHGVDLVLSGHNHFYERFHSINGVSYVTVGSGAKLGRGELNRDAPGLAAGNDSTHVFLALEFTPSACQLRAIDFLDNVIDDVTIEKIGSATEFEIVDRR